jgi:uncharacterized membrane protein YeiH
MLASRANNTRLGRLPVQRCLASLSARGLSTMPSEAPPPTPVKLTRYPTELSAGGVLRGMDYIGTAAFSLTGGAAAAASGMDLFGSLVVGTITAVGGGTIRDALFLSKQPFWTEETEYLGISAVGAAIAFYLTQRDGGNDDVVQNNHLVADWGDALGVGAFCVIGANNALAMAMPLSVCVICGISTATFGGCVRDVLRQKPPRILHSHTDIYATCAGAGALVYTVAGRHLGLRTAAMVSGVGTAMLMRWAAWTYDVRLPVALPATSPKVEDTLPPATPVASSKRISLP